MISFTLATASPTVQHKWSPWPETVQQKLIWPGGAHWVWSNPLPVRNLKPFLVIDRRLYLPYCWPSSTSPSSMFAFGAFLLLHILPQPHFAVNAEWYLFQTIQRPFSKHPQGATIHRKTQTQWQWSNDKTRRDWCHSFLKYFSIYSTCSCQLAGQWHFQILTQLLEINEKCYFSSKVYFAN